MIYLLVQNMKIAQPSHLLDGANNYLQLVLAYLDHQVHVNLRYKKANLVLLHGVLRYNVRRSFLLFYNYIF